VFRDRVVLDVVATGVTLFFSFVGLIKLCSRTPCPPSPSALRSPSPLTSRYPARINQVSGAKDSPLYTITFKGYTGSTNVPLSSLRPHDPNAPIPKPAQPKKTEVTDREREKKKKKGEKWMATQKAQADEARAVQHSWQKFGKKAAKKGIHIAGLEGKSVFRTSDSAYSEYRVCERQLTLLGRVGVVNSGKGMTAYERMGKHKYEKALDE